MRGVFRETLGQFASIFVVTHSGKPKHDPFLSLTKRFFFLLKPTLTMSTALSQHNF